MVYLLLIMIENSQNKNSFFCILSSVVQGEFSLHSIFFLPKNVKRQVNEKKKRKTRKMRDERKKNGTYENRNGAEASERENTA